MNYPSVQIVSPLGDTIGNAINNVNLFAQLGNTMQVYSDTITEFGITDFSSYTFVMNEGFGSRKGVIYWCTTLGIENTESEPVLFFPNPVIDFLHVKAGAGSGILQIFNTQGKLCFENKISSDAVVNLSHLSQGIYIARYIDKKHVSNFRILKQ
jgi:hypothetical protein